MIIQDSIAPIAAESDCATVFVAIELSRSSWVVAAHTPPVDKIGLHKLAAGDVVPGEARRSPRGRAPALLQRSGTSVRA